jgi:hypothetical protein
MVSGPITVTFDTNTLDRAARPQRFPKDIRRTQYAKVHCALASGAIRGFFSETLVTLEGIENKDRCRVLGTTRLDRKAQDTGKSEITISLRVMQDREPLHPEVSRRLGAAQALGMRALRGPSRIGSIRVRDDDGTFYEPYSTVLELAECLDNANSVATAIEARRVGRVVALSLGLRFNARAGVTGEWWLQGLKRTKDDSERKQVQKAISEWADADSVASHIGYGFSLFCSEDWGKSTGGMPSILDEPNRAWLA